MMAGLARSSAAAQCEARSAASGVSLTCDARLISFLLSSRFRRRRQRRSLHDQSGLVVIASDLFGVRTLPEWRWNISLRNRSWLQFDPVLSMPQDARAGGAGHRSMASGRRQTNLDWRRSERILRLRAKTAFLSVHGQPAASGNAVTVASLAQFCIIRPVFNGRQKVEAKNTIRVFMREKRRDKVMKICRRIAIQRILTHRFK